MGIAVAEKLAEFAAADMAAHEGARQMVRLSIFDWASCGIAGQSEPVARILRQRVTEDGGRPEASLIGGQKVPARAAALANGTASHALDYDDTHFAHIGHPSVAVIPAALAMAEAGGAGMDQLIDAALVGVEASVRIGQWLGRGHYQIGFHQTATAGAFGATLACARLMGLTPGQTVHALGLAATRASGLKSQFGTMGKPYNAGIAAESGVETARLAALGMTSSPEALAGSQGFGPTHAGAGDETAFDQMGQSYIFESISHKFHACCHGTHAAIEALGALRLDPAQVKSIVIETHPAWMSVCNKPGAATGLEAKFSYKVVAGMVLCGVDTASPASFDDALGADPAIRAIADITQVIASPELTETQARVKAAMVGGAAKRAEHDLTAPISLEAREKRLRIKAARMLGDQAAASLWQAVQARALSGILSELQG